MIHLPVEYLPLLFDMQQGTQTVHLGEACEEWFLTPICLRKAGDGFGLGTGDFDIHGKPNEPRSNLGAGVSQNPLLPALREGTEHESFWQ
jgi:hypothetical protein